ncbi:MAG TPA: hypothetical protein VI306_19150 [Pyrinomonadaceae bacterium]
MPQVKKENMSYGGDDGGNGDCDGFRCDWTWSKSGFGCDSGEGGCFAPIFSEAELSDFHTADLEEATKKIKRIIAKIPKDPQGRKLSLCYTNMGFLLAWTTPHGSRKVVKTGVTRRDSNAKVARALKLKVK